MRLQVFNGGLATRVKPHMIEQNEGVVYTNIDNSVGTLLPVKAKTATDISVYKYSKYYASKAMWYSKATKTDFVEFRNTLYLTDRINQPKKFNGITENNLGIAPPVKITSKTATASPEPVKDIAINSVAGSGGYLPYIDLHYLLVNTSSTRFSNIMQVTVKATGAVAATATNAKTITDPPTVQQINSWGERYISIANPTGIIIGTLGVQVFRYHNGAYRKVGTLTTSSSSISDTVYDIGGGTTFDEDKVGPLQGILQYSYSYYNSLDGSESGLSVPSDEIRLENGGHVYFPSLPASGDAQVTHKRLYRIGGDLTEFSLVATIPDATTTYLDELPDSDIPGDLAQTEESAAAPAGLAYLITAYGMLLGCKDNRLYFTEIDKPDSWPVLYFLSFESTLTGAIPVANGILVFTKLKTFLVTGTSPETFNTILLSADQGCIAFESVASVGGAALWVSTDGICQSSGGVVQVLSRPKLGKQTLTPVSSIVYDEVYYCLNEDSTILAYDYGLGGVFKKLTLGIEYLVVADDVLYGWSANTLFSLFTSESRESLSYLSPEIYEGRVTELKAYKKIFVYSSGYVKIDIYIDRVLVTSAEYTDTGTNTIQVPQDLQRGFSIQFGVSGTGEVYEIQSDPTGRQNG